MLHRVPSLHHKLPLPHMMILKSITNVFWEHHDSFLQSWSSRLCASLLFYLDPLESKGNGVTMLLLKYPFAHIAARAVVVATPPRPNKCQNLDFLCTCHTLWAIATILLVSTVNFVVEASMLWQLTMNIPLPPATESATQANWLFAGWYSRICVDMWWHTGHLVRSQCIGLKRTASWSQDPNFCRLQEGIFSRLFFNGFGPLCTARGIHCASWPVWKTARLNLVFGRAQRMQLATFSLATFLSTICWLSSSKRTILSATKAAVLFLKWAVMEVHLNFDKIIRSSKEFACSKLLRKKSWDGWWTIVLSHSRMLARVRGAVLQYPAMKYVDLGGSCIHDWQSAHQPAILSSNA